ncbi:MAG: hypothetical protein AAF416_02460 [Pseudomonadota bacterium]
MLLAGATGAGKSGLALGLAEPLDGWVVNADSQQVYAPWRILTARPGPAEEARVPHKLYGHLPLGAAHSTLHSALSGAMQSTLASLAALRNSPPISGGSLCYTILGYLRRPIPF